MKSVIILAVLVAACSALSTEERLKWLENTVIHIQRLKGIQGERGAMGMRGPPGDTKFLEAKVDMLTQQLSEVRWNHFKLSGMVAAVILWVIYKSLFSPS